MSDLILRDAWHVVAAAEQLQPDQLLQVHLLGEAIVLWRIGQQVIACQDRCPHRGASLALGKLEAEHLICPYHAMSFNAAGRCTRIPASPQLAAFPATVHLRTYAVQEKYGLVWVTLGKPTQDIPVFAAWTQPEFATFHCGPYPVRSSAPRLIENFIDIAHLPFVHSGLLGDPHLPTVSDYSLHIRDGAIATSQIRCYQPNPDGAGTGRSVAYTYQIPRPLIAWFSKGDAEQQLVIFLTVTPVEETHSIAWFGVARNYLLDLSTEELRAFQDQIIHQDIPIVESQRPQKLPLHLEQEFHFPCDQLSIAYRQWLKQLGLQFGTC